MWKSENPTHMLSTQQTLVKSGYNLQVMKEVHQDKQRAQFPTSSKWLSLLIHNLPWLTSFVLMWMPWSWREEADSVSILVPTECLAVCWTPVSTEAHSQKWAGIEEGSRLEQGYLSGVRLRHCQISRVGQSGTLGNPDQPCVTAFYFLEDSAPWEQHCVTQRI